MTVQEILTHKGHQIIFVSPNDTVLEAAQRMNAARIGAVVVFEPNHGVVGIFTERDVLRRVVGEGKPPASTLVREVMTSPVTCCHLTTSLTECKDVMTKKRLRHLPVIEEGELFGMVSSGDIFAHEVALQQSTIEYLHEYLHGRA
jgi:CBS domain-containing protein